MKKSIGILLTAVLAAGVLSARAADQPAKQTQPPSKEQAQKDKPRDTPKDKPTGGTQRRTQIPET